MEDSITQNCNCSSSEDIDENSQKYLLYGNKEITISDKT